MKTKKQVFFSCYACSESSFIAFYDGSLDFNKAYSIQELRDDIANQIKEKQNLLDDDQIHFLNLNIVDVLDEQEIEK